MKLQEIMDKLYECNLIVRLFDDEEPFFDCEIADDIDYDWEVLKKHFGNQEVCKMEGAISWYGNPCLICTIAMTYQEYLEKDLDF